MSDKSLVVTLPEELIEEVAARHIDIQAVVEKTLRFELDEISQWGSSSLAIEEKEILLYQLLPPHRMAEGLQLLHTNKRISGLSGGQVWMSEDFDDPLPDEEWGDLFA
ncbi:MAG: hypothetical protein ABI947_20310 [Chloroflexota bacterium]